MPPVKRLISYLAGAVSLLGGASLLYSLTRIGNDRVVTMHPDDWWDGREATTIRYFKSPGQVLHHVRELAGLSLPVARVYLARAIEPSFRERVMILTAMANECPS